MKADFKNRQQNKWIDDYGKDILSGNLFNPAEIEIINQFAQDFAKENEKNIKEFVKENLEIAKGSFQREPKDSIDKKFYAGEASAYASMLYVLNQKFKEDES